MEFLGTSGVGLGLDTGVVVGLALPVVAIVGLAVGPVGPVGAGVWALLEKKISQGVVRTYFNRVISSAVIVLTDWMNEVPRCCLLNKERNNVARQSYSSISSTPLVAADEWDVGRVFDWETASTVL